MKVSILIVSGATCVSKQRFKTVLEVPKHNSCKESATPVEIRSGPGKLCHIYICSQHPFYLPLRDCTGDCTIGENYVVRPSHDEFDY